VQTAKPFNVNFFCHAPPRPDAEREAAWRATLASYYEEFGVDVSTTVRGAGRASLSHEVANVLDEFRPAVVNFHFGLPSPELLARIRGWGAKVLSSTTTVDETRWWRRAGRCDHHARIRCSSG
jgi:nitronate monooxygenase